VIALSRPDPAMLEWRDWTAAAIGLALLLAGLLGL
jgi:hypothetical protein